MSVVGMASVSSVDVEGGDRGILLHLKRIFVFCPIIRVLQKKKKIPVLKGSASDPEMVSGAAAVTEARAPGPSSSSYQAYEHSQAAFPLTSPASSV